MKVGPEIDIWADGTESTHGGHVSLLMSLTEGREQRSQNRYLLCVLASLNYIVIFPLFIIYISGWRCSSRKPGGRRGNDDVHFGWRWGALSSWITVVFLSSHIFLVIILKSKCWTSTFDFLNVTVPV